MKIQKNFDRSLFYLLEVISLISFLGGSVYKIYSLNALGVALTLILTLVIFFILQFFWKKNNFLETGAEEAEPAAGGPALAFTYLGLWLVSIYILFLHRSSAALISPWTVLPAYFFILYGLATAILLLIISRRRTFPSFLLSLHYFLSFSVALIIYKIGYGFDPFIHQATMGLIDKTGSVEPKPFYYLGQYALVVIAHKLTYISIIRLDKVLVPLLASLYLPFLLSVSFPLLKDKRTTALAALAVLAIPLPIFILTTPQNLAYLFLLSAIILAPRAGSGFEIAFIYLLALAALLTHPIAGLPALALALFLTVGRKMGKAKKFVFPLLAVLTAAALPLAFYLFEKSYSGSPASFDIFKSLADIFSSFRMDLAGQENLFLNFTYLYGFNFQTIYLILSVAGFFLYRRKDKEFSAIFAYLSLSLLLAYLLTLTLPFRFLISYEREDYAGRVLILSALFAAPFVFSALRGMIAKVLARGADLRLPFAGLLVFLITASFYLTYPRFDNYFNSRGLSTGRSDLEAVRLIDKEHRGDYIVLADQQVSAGALREFGFKKYYEPHESGSVEAAPATCGLKETSDCASKPAGDPIFFYPIPTGGPLYQYYLAMVYDKPSRETMDKAMDLAGVREGYLVLNKYWWAFPKILDEAKFRADEWWSIGDGEVYVFRYERDLK